MKAKVTIREVAKAAGVAVGTASRALNRTGRVSEKAIAAVTKAARDLGYQPDAVAQSMRTRSRITSMTTGTRERSSRSAMAGPAPVAVPSRCSASADAVGSGVAEADATAVVVAELAADVPVALGELGDGPECGDHGDAGLGGVGAVAGLAGELEGDDASDIALHGEELEVKHEPRMLRVARGHAAGSGEVR